MISVHTRPFMSVRRTLTTSSRAQLLLIATRGRFFFIFPWWSVCTSALPAILVPLEVFPMETKICPRYSTMYLTSVRTRTPMSVVRTPTASCALLLIAIRGRVFLCIPLVECVYVCTPSNTSHARSTFRGNKNMSQIELHVLNKCTYSYSHVDPVYSYSILCSTTDCL